MAGKRKGKVQGEGDYEAARRYDEDVNDFVSDADIDGLAKQAAPRSPSEKADFERAEQAGRSRSKGEDAVDHMSAANEDEDDDDIGDDDDIDEDEDDEEED